MYPVCVVIIVIGVGQLLLFGFLVVSYPPPPTLLHCFTLYLNTSLPKWCHLGCFFCHMRPFCSNYDPYYPGIIHTFVHLLSFQTFVYIYIRYGVPHKIPHSFNGYCFLLSFPFLQLGSNQLALWIPTDSFFPRSYIFVNFWISLVN